MHQLVLYRIKEMIDINIHYYPETARALFPNFLFKNSLGALEGEMAVAKMTDPAERIQRYLQFLKIAPASELAPTYKNLIEVYFRQANFQEVENYRQKLVALQPEVTQHWRDLANFYLFLEDFKKAYPCLLEVSNRSTKIDATLIGDLISTCLQLKRYQEADV